MPFQSRIKALNGIVGTGVNRRAVWQRYCEFKRHVLGSQDISSVVWQGVVVEVALSVASDLLRELNLGKPADRHDDDRSGYVQEQVRFGADTYIIRIREDEGMPDARIACILPANLNNGKGREWVHPNDRRGSNPQAAPVARQSSPVAAPVAQSAAQKAPASNSSSSWPEGWGPPGEGGVNLKLLNDEYARLKRTVYRGLVPEGSVTVVVWWKIAENLWGKLNFGPDPKGRSHVIVATVDLAGDSVTVCLSTRKLEDKKKKEEKFFGFQIDNVPGREGQGPEWWWPGFKIGELKLDPRVAKVTAAASGLRDRIPKLKRPRD